jgi:hypothetical protein
MGAWLGHNGRLSWGCKPYSIRSEPLKSKAQREFELSAMMLNDKPALHREYKRVTRKSPGAVTDRSLIQTILQIEYPPTGKPQPRNKTRANPTGKVK